MRRIVLLLALVAASVLAPAAPAQSTLDPNVPPPPDKIRIDVVGANGTGCPDEESAEIIVSPDNTAFTVLYNQYVAQVGPGTPGFDRKNCQLNILVHIPQGFTYAVAEADYRGYMYLERGARAEQHAGYYFTGTTPTARTVHKFNGPKDTSWQVTDTVEAGLIVWHPCGAWRNFNINTELRAYRGTSGGSTSSMIQMDSTDGSINTVYRLSWKRCPR